MEKKLSKYFSHDTTAMRDRKILRLRKVLGAEGYGVYWMLIETLSNEPDFSYPLVDIDLLENDFNVSKEKIEAVIKQFELFDIDQNAKFFSLSLIARMQKFLEVSERARKAVNKRWEKARKLKQLNTNVLPQYNDSNTNKRKEKKIKLKENNLKPFVEDSNEFRLSKLLNNLILERNPNNKSPDLQGWAKKIDLMIRIDKRTLKEIEGAIRWSQQDLFWQNNILSTRSLRRQFDQLYLKAKAEKNNGTHKSVITEDGLRRISEGIKNDPRYT